ncbi:MAG TPA: pentapeptide repeat-containing protein, partial [Candidatus Limnocylindrales bacterium]|nr:pentapeptide repeat-containing protein [Candidatus Limnocylindrales bacterium]
MLANGCSVAKVRATTKNFSCRIREHGKVLRGKDADFNRCDEKLVAAFTKAETTSSCPSTGDSATAILLAANAASGVFDDLDASSAAEDEIACVLAKARAATVYAKCQSAALGKRLANLYLGIKLDFDACRNALDAAFVAAEDHGPCATIGDSVVVENTAGAGYGFLPNVDWHSNVSWNYLYPAHAALPNAYLVGNNISYGLFPAANLSGADLTDSNLSRTVWSEADLSGANLTGVDFSRSTLDSGTNVEGAKLGTANLTDVRAWDLVGCPATLPTTWQCREHLLAGPTARLSGGIFSAFDLSGTDLTDAYVPSAQFIGANLAEITLAGAD